MPTYQYRCKSCQSEFEVRQSFADDALSTCPDSDCGGAVSKVFSGVGISFRGDGFYKNDHGSSAKDRGGDTGSTTKPASDSGSSDSSTSDSSNSGSTSESKGTGTSDSGGSTEKAPAATSG
ncbi:MAG: FmdB family transcriptional regulator [Acidimicrobiaceae bacterium]|jgi:putative FmdB family regulatory protein|nr:FmdB family transcriptional regulator [Acidimicrobiaceae bacterium]